MFCLFVNRSILVYIIALSSTVLLSSSVLSCPVLYVCCVSRARTVCAASMACELPDLIRLSVPVYPVISFGLCSQSKVENYGMPILPAVMMDWFSNRYFRGGDDLLNPLVCPLRRSGEELAKVCKTHVITAQYDVLRDEGIAYVHALKAAGVDVTHKNYDNTVHGFFGNAAMTHGSQALLDAAVVIRDYFAS